MTKRQPFRIEIEDVKKIYDDFQIPRYSSREEFYHLGETALNEPLEKISVTAKTDGETYESLANINSILPYGIWLRKKINLPINALKEKFSVWQLGNTAYILGKDGKPEYELNSDNIISGGIDICVGRGPSIGNKNTPRKKIESLEKFIFEMHRYKDLIETTVNGIYGINENISENVMYWKPVIKQDNFPTKIVDFSSKLEKKHDDFQSKIEMEIPEISFEDIGGQEEAKKEIQSLSFALKNAKLYLKWGTRPPKGILLYGPPGTGKTLMAKALANEANAKFYHVKASDVTNKWYGESERIIQSIFNLAKKNDKTIIFFDELDSLAPHRDYSHEASGRIVSTMLVNLDGIDSNKNLMIVGSTNRIDSIDPALLRPGRVDRLVEVPLPDVNGRKQIFNIHKRKAENIAKRKLFNEGAYEHLIHQDKFSGADIYEIVRRSLEEKVRQEGYGQKPSLVSEKDIEKQIKLYERTIKVRKAIGFNSNKK